MATSQDFVNWVCSEQLSYKFLQYLFIAEGEDLLRFASGAIHQTIYFPEAKAFHICHPPLSEQQRIVGVLDEALAGISRAAANGERNLQNSRGLFESYLQSAFDRGREGCVERPLAETAVVFADGDWVESKDQSPEGIRLIQTGNVGNGVFKDRGEKSRYISAETFKRLRCTEIFAGDCLISRLPHPVGRSCLLRDTGTRMITAVDCTIVRFDPKQIIPAFFNYYAQSHAYLRAVDSETTGTTRKRISRSKLGRVLVPVVAIPDQHRIVSSLDDLSVETQRLASIYEQKLAALDRLKNSLLHQAFTGQL